MKIEDEINKELAKNKTIQYALDAELDATKNKFASNITENMQYTHQGTIVKRVGEKNRWISKIIERLKIVMGWN